MVVRMHLVVLETAFQAALLWCWRPLSKRLCFETPSQMDLLENPALEDVIVLSVVLEEVKHRNASVYQRLRKLCADPARRFFVFANENHRCYSSLVCGRCRSMFGGVNWALCAAARAPVAAPSGGIA